MRPEADDSSFTCPRCGAPVDCGYRAGRDTCWCANYPPAFAVPADPSARCYCESCLGELSSRSRPRPVSDS